MGFPKFIKGWLKKNCSATALMKGEYVLNHGIKAKKFDFYNPNHQRSMFFIVGVGRSGSTLLRAMLCSHPNVSIPPEFYGFRGLVRTFNLYACEDWLSLVQEMVCYLEKVDDFDTWSVDLKALQKELNQIPKTDRNLQSFIHCLYHFYAQTHFPNSSCLGDKTPLNTKNLDWISLVYPNAKFILMERDGKDVALSLKQSKLVETLTAGAERVVAYRRLWDSFLRKRPRTNFITIQYANLVTSPEVELQKVSSFLGITFDKKMLDFNNAFSKLGDTQKYRHHANVGRKLNVDSIGRWRRELNVKEVKLLDNILGNY